MKVKSLSTTFGVLIFNFFFWQKVDGIYFPSSIYNELQNQCKWEGQKIAHPGIGDKLFLCHFYGNSDRWLLYPLQCATDYHFDVKKQRCSRIEPSRNQFIENAVPLLGTQVTEFPNSYSHYEKPIMPNNGISGPKHGDRITKLGQGNLKYNCDDHIKSLLSTIKTMSRTIEKLSEKIESRRNNTTINFAIPNLASAFPRFPIRIPGWKPHGIANQHYFPTPGNLATKQNMDSKFNVTPRPVPTPSKLLTKNEIPITTSSTVVPSTTSPPLQPGKLESPEQNSYEMDPFSKAGNNLFDFLFKNVLKMTSSTPSPPSAPKIPFKGNFPSSQPHYGMYKPSRPFRPRPSPFFPGVHPIQTKPPMPGNFINVFSFLDNLDKNPVRPHQIPNINESVEDDVEGNELAQDRLSKSSTTFPKHELGSSSSTTFATPSTLTLSENESNTEALEIETILESSVSPPLVTAELSDSAESRDEGNNEGEKAEDSLRLNNRKPRGV